MLRMLQNLVTLVTKRFQSEKGQSMVEYGMIIGLVAVGVVALLVILGGQIQDMFKAIVIALGWVPPA